MHGHRKSLSDVRRQIIGGLPQASAGDHGPAESSPHTPQYHSTSVDRIMPIVTTQEKHLHGDGAQALAERERRAPDRALLLIMRFGSDQCPPGGGASRPPLAVRAVVNLCFRRSPSADPAGRKIAVTQASPVSSALAVFDDARMAGHGPRNLAFFDGIHARSYGQGMMHFVPGDS